MAHASSLEKGKLLMKKFREARNKKRKALNSLTIEEREEKRQARSAAPPESAQTDSLIFDFMLNQLPKHKYSLLKELCEKREKEIYASHTQELNKAQLQRIQEALKKLEVVQNGTNVRRI